MAMAPRPRITPSRVATTMLALAACSEPADPKACGVNLHGDDTHCGDGHSDPGELCLTLAASLPAAKFMYRLHNLTLADFNGDHHLDLRIGSDIHTGTGDGTFSETFIRTSGSTDARDVAAGDFNGDGITDLAYVTYSINVFADPDLEEDRKQLTIWTGNPTLDPGDAHQFSDLLFEYPANLVAADFNDDGLDDLAIAIVTWDIDFCDPVIYLRDPDLPTPLSFTQVDRLSGVNGALGCRLATFDIDADGHADIDTTLAEFYAGDGSGKFTPRTTERPIAVVATHGHDLNCDGIPDAVARHDDATQVWQGLGAGEFKVVEPALNTLDVASTVARLNHDAEPDVLTAGAAGLRIFAGDADFGFSAAIPLAEHTDYSELAVADLNEDGHPDVVALRPAGADIFLTHP